MMQYQKDSQDPIPTSEITIIGLGGAGSNITDCVSRSGLKGLKNVTANADLRTLESSLATDKVQLGAHIRRGLACGGDPELGLKAAQETESELRAVIAGSKIVFLCVGLGGGTGSGAAPLITRIAREENAFIVVFATMPFSFEGRRRRAQAEAALNELSVIANALVTFDNGRMAELVSPTQSVHDAFEAANQLISTSIESISRIALYPGIVHLGLDDLVSTLDSTRSRCLFGSGVGRGESRVKQALDLALSSPLLDRGKLLESSENVLVHICGGATTTMSEADELMNELIQHLNVSAQIFFGISIDDQMGDEFSTTIISSLPEEDVLVSDRQEEKSAVEPAVSTPAIQPAALVSPVSHEEFTEEPSEVESERLTVPVPVSTSLEEAVTLNTHVNEPVAAEPEREPVVESPVVEEVPYEPAPVESAPASPVAPAAYVAPEPPAEPEVPQEPEAVVSPEPPVSLPNSVKWPEPPVFEEPKEEVVESKTGLVPGLTQPAAEPKPLTPPPVVEAPEPVEVRQPEPPILAPSPVTPPPPVQEVVEPTPPEPAEIPEPIVEPEPVEVPVTPTPPVISDHREEAQFVPQPVQQPVAPEPVKEVKPEPTSSVRRRFAHLFTNKETAAVEEQADPSSLPLATEHSKEEEAQISSELQERSKFKLPVTEKKQAASASKKTKSQPTKIEDFGELFANDFSQGELQLDGQPKGRFEGESPNIYEGQDLDVPTFMRTSE